MRLKSYIPIQTDSIEFTPRTNYSNTVILIRLNPPEITRIFTGLQRPTLCSSLPKLLSVYPTNLKVTPFITLISNHTSFSHQPTQLIQKKNPSVGSAMVPIQSLHLAPSYGHHHHQNGIRLASSLRQDHKL